MLDLVAHTHTFDSSTQKAEAGQYLSLKLARFNIVSFRQAVLHNETLSLKKEKKKEKGVTYVVHKLYKI